MKAKVKYHIPLRGMKAKVKYHIPLRGTKAWGYYNVRANLAARGDEFVFILLAVANDGRINIKIR